MIKQQILFFILRWLVSSAAMAICINLFAQVDGTPSLGLYFVAGFIFSLVNSIVKPLATLFSLPLIILTMGIFTLILNVAMVGLTIWILPTVSISLGGAILSTIIISLINWLVNILVPGYRK